MSNIAKTVNKLLNNNNNNSNVNTNNINKRIKNINKTLNQLKRRTNNQKRNRYRAKRRQRMALPAATTSNFVKRFMVDRLTATSARVSGSDLVYTIPNEITTNNNTNVITIIPSNPAYWTGTRIANIAMSYQNFRPVKFIVHYVPQVAVTQQGNVIGGTLWHDAPPSNNLQQTLRTSNGGIMTQCFRRSSSLIRLGSNLQYNLFRTGGDIDEQSMPFYYIGISVACKNSNNVQVVPGYFYVEYSFIFKNPIGNAINYYNSGLTLFNNVTSKISVNTVAILCNDLVTEKATLNVGTVLDIEYDINEDVYNFVYNGTPVDQPAGLIWILSNGPNQTLSKAQMQAATKIPILYDNKIVQDEPPKVPPHSAIIYKSVDEDPFISIFVNKSQLLTDLTGSAVDKTYYVTNNVNQNFGILSNILNDFQEFLAKPTEYLIKKAVSV